MTHYGCIYRSKTQYLKNLGAHSRSVLKGLYTIKQIFCSVEKMNEKWTSGALLLHSEYDFSVLLWVGNFPLSLFDHVWESRAAWTAVGRLLQPCAINRHAGNKHVHLPFISVPLLQHRENRISTTGPPKARVSAHQATSLYSLSTNEEDAVSVTASVLNISWGYGVLNVNNTQEQKVHEDH